MALNWYVVRVQVGREEKIRDSLLGRVKAQALEAGIPQVIVPTEKVTEMRRGKRSVRERKLYPGYMMIEMELNEKTWYTVRETPGVGDFLGLKQPVPMATHEVEKMVMATMEVPEQPKLKIDIAKGDPIRIREGPFENFDGIVEDIIPAKGIVIVSITIFGRATKVELEYWQLEKN